MHYNLKPKHFFPPSPSIFCNILWACFAGVLNYIIPKVNFNWACVFVCIYISIYVDGESKNFFAPFLLEDNCATLYMCPDKPVPLVRQSYGISNSSCWLPWLRNLSLGCGHLHVVTSHVIPVNLSSEAVEALFCSVILDVLHIFFLKLMNNIKL